MKGTFCVFLVILGLTAIFAHPDLARDTESSSTSAGADKLACDSKFGTTPVPCFLQHMVANAPDQISTTKEVAQNNILQLDVDMMNYYDASLVGFAKNMMDRLPIIVGLFDNTGSTMSLFMPGATAPIKAPAVPLIYQLLKSICHSTMAVYEILVPYVGTASLDKSWIAPARVFRTSLQVALDGIPDIEASNQTKSYMTQLLNYNIDFLTKVIDARTYDYTTLETFTRGPVATWIEPMMNEAALTQVRHWETVIESWKTLLGEQQWNRTYAVCNSLFVTRQNHILYTVLLQYMGYAAVKERLILLETPQFTSTNEQMLGVLSRIVADRALGEVFFKSYFLMDAELLNSAAREALESEAKRKGVPVLLPEQAPFDTQVLPWSTTKVDGYGPATMAEARIEGNGDAQSHVPTCPYKKRS